jgi:isopentenyl-diphosphate Delta-isomerase
MLLLVNDQDTIIGQEEKLKTHELGLLHRAFSVYVMSRQGEVLLQQRALSKYHSGGLRANTCCSHQMLDEAHETAGHRRLQEEMGFDCQMQKATEFIYKVAVPPGLIEHEYLHVFVGLYE